MGADITIPSITQTALGVSAFICFGGLVVYLVMLYGRIHLRHVVLGFVVNVVAVLFLESSVHNLLLTEDSYLSTHVIACMFYLAILSALIEELSRFGIFRYGLGKSETVADAAIGFAIGFALVEVVVGGISNLSAYALASYLGETDLTTMLSEAGDDAELVREQLEVIAETSALDYILSGINRIFYVAREVALSVITWYAATRDDQRKLLPAALGLHILVRLPDCFYQAGGSIPLLAEEVVSYLLTIGLCVLAARLYKKLEEPVFHFKIDTLKARRRR